MLDIVLDLFYEHWKKALLIVAIVLLAFLGYKYYDMFFHKQITFKKSLVLPFQQKEIYPFDVVEKIDGKAIKEYEIKEDTLFIGRWKLVANRRVDLSKVGKTSVVFTTNEKNPRIFEKVIEVKDVTPPMVVFKKTKITLLKSQLKDFKYSDNIAEISDDYEGKDGIVVEARSQLSIIDSIGEKEFVVVANDRSGNQKEYSFLVEIKEDPVPEKKIEKEIIYKDRIIYKPTTSPSKSQTTIKPKLSQSTTKAKVSPSNNHIHGSQRFLFSNGYNMDTGYKACTAKGDHYSNYSCTPMKNKDGIYIGYLLEY
ncbi:hypothetical protein [Bulleidia sp. zg-1006]|uniref:hypothetical protein n=1 Tax=Bulleidia sp. zg-1006 TaxID=2806552 RepID=UPI00193A44F7|nr:hypothetical protein [Bulleidia sp. zg-1006]QRG86070.1 hypothetical protein JOS54_04135 [Bulleidia sp. zg-1006]